MKMTDYAFENLSASSPVLPSGVAGAEAHARFCAHDTGDVLVLTGKDYAERPIRREVRSLTAAYATMVGVSGLTRAWHIRPDGTRRLALTR